MEWLKKIRRRWHGDIAQWNEDLKNVLIEEVGCCKNELQTVMSDKAMSSFTQGTSVDMTYQQLCHIYNALQDDLSRTLFLGRVEYSITHILTGVFRAMLCAKQLHWVSTKVSYAEERYGLSGLWDLLKENYPVQKHEIYLLAFDDAWNEYTWVVEQFLRAIPGLGIKLSGCIMPTKIPMVESYLGLPCIAEKEFFEHINSNTRIIIGFPGWMLETKDIVERYKEYKEILFPIADTKRPQYIEPDLFKLGKNEVFVDVGVFDLQDSINFNDWSANSCKKIYGFEPDPTCYQRSLARLNQMNPDFQNKMELIHKGLSTKNGVLEFPAVYNPSGGNQLSSYDTVSVEVVSLDSFLAGEPVTFVKMDVEGAEMDVLRGMEWTIRHHKPRLAVCVYHKHEDIFEISSYLLDLVPEYKFYLRHYNSNETETVLFCTI